jgi:DNA-binding GntR family transcriptional regulator
MLHEETISRIRELLIEGQIAPGARIPEQALCASLGISRTPLREALKVLAAEGHVVLLPHRGARAARLTVKDVRNLFEVSAALESAAGELACLRIDDDAIAAIAALHGEMQRHFAAGEIELYYVCNRAIHEAIVRASDNQVLIGLYDGVNTRIRRARYVAPMTPGHWRIAMSEHEAMLNALQRRDGAMLALVLKTHLRHKADEVERAGFAETIAPP